MKERIYELLKEANVDTNSTLGKELIAKYNNAFEAKQKELKELENKLLAQAESDFLKTIKGDTNV